MVPRAAFGGGPGAWIGAGNFFELAVAAAISWFGPGFPAAPACVVGVLVEVPVMLSACRFCNARRSWYQRVLEEPSVGAAAEPS